VDAAALSSMSATALAMLQHMTPWTGSNAKQVLVPALSDQQVGLPAQLGPMITQSAHNAAALASATAVATDDDASPNPASSDNMQVSPPADVVAADAAATATTTAAVPSQSDAPDTAMDDVIEWWEDSSDSDSGNAPGADDGCVVFGVASPAFNPAVHTDATLRAALAAAWWLNEQRSIGTAAGVSSAAASLTDAKAALHAAGHYGRGAVSTSAAASTDTAATAADATAADADAHVDDLLLLLVLDIADGLGRAARRMRNGKAGVMRWRGAATFHQRAEPLQCAGSSQEMEEEQQQQLPDAAAAGGGGGGSGAAAGGGGAAAAAHPPTPAPLSLPAEGCAGPSWAGHHSVLVSWGHLRLLLEKPHATAALRGMLAADECWQPIAGAHRQRGHCGSIMNKLALLGTQLWYPWAQHYCLGCSILAHNIVASAAVSLHNIVDSAAVSLRIKCRLAGLLTHTYVCMHACMHAHPTLPTGASSLRMQSLPAHLSALLLLLLCCPQALTMNAFLVWMMTAAAASLLVARMTLTATAEQATAGWTSMRHLLLLLWAASSQQAVLVAAAAAEAVDLSMLLPQPMPSLHTSSQHSAHQTLRLLLLLLTKLLLLLLQQLLLLLTKLQLLWKLLLLMMLLLPLLKLPLLLLLLLVVVVIVMMMMMMKTQTLNCS
jgi:hypothetical protein